jgi:hypothetical protein
MSSRVISRRTTVLLCTAALLLVSAFAAAPQADAATLYACVKKNGAARVYTKKPKCKKGETKLSWNSDGVQGRNGLNGLNGLNGPNGANGSSGTNGKDLTSHTPLPSGQSESGFFAAAAGESKTGYAATGISFSQPLAEASPVNHVIYQTLATTSTNCPGFGQAKPGFACLYESESSGTAFLVARDFTVRENAADKYGFAVFFTVSAPSAFVAGSWTVTAP